MAGRVLMAPVLFRVNGSLVPAVRFQSVSIHDVLGAPANTGSLVFDSRGVAVDVGAAIQIGVGSFDPPDLLFAGQVQHLVETYQSDVRQARLHEWPADLIDHVFAINRRRPFQSYYQDSATDIARALIAGWAPGFSAAAVQANLPALVINFDGTTPLMECLNQVAQAIGGRTKVDYTRTVHLYIPPEGGVPDPDPITGSNPPLNVPPIQFDIDLSQVRTRVYGKGHGETTPTDVLANDAIVPVDSTAFFNPAGGRAIAGLTADGAQTQRWTYTGVQAGGSGTLVGPGAAPVAAPVVTAAAGSGIEAGAHDWAYTWVTAAGESKPSPVRTLNLGALPAPNSPMSAGFQSGSGGPVPAGTSIQYTTAYMDLTSTVRSTISTSINTQTGTGTAGYWHISFTIQAAMVGYVPVVMRRDNGGSWYGVGVGGVVAAGEVGGVRTLNDTYATASAFGGGVVYTAAAAGRAALSAIAVGPSSVTARKLYRTAANLSALKLLTTLADNTTTTYTDSAADATLGAAAPSADTSGLTQPAGQVNAGSTAIITASAAPFAPGGGWVAAGQQWIRYTGISGNTLTGIPTSGPGAITTTILYGDQLVAVPALLGVVGNTRGLQRGSTVAVFVQRDDVAAQTALGLLERNPDGSPTDGIREYMLIDERRGEPSLIDLCDADLAAFARPIIGVTYATRDPKSKAGQTAHLDLRLGATGVFNPAVFNPAVFHTGAAPGDVFGYAGDFLIQEVTITFDPTAPDPLPRYLVRASSSRFTFMDLLQRVALVS